MSKLSKFGEIVRVKRVLNRESLADLAKAVGCSPSLISAVEIGQKTPTVELALSVCAHYDMDLDDSLTLLTAAMNDLNQVRNDQIKSEVDKRLSAIFALFKTRADDTLKESAFNFLDCQLKERLAA